MRILMPIQFGYIPAILLDPIHHERQTMKAMLFRNANQNNPRMTL
jgi:hypothetical protein